uniref:Uncharacterized protein n=1 Tax=Plectus sambesii TaxID=2011161 RepID=A0A914WQZ0_9BILA
MTTTSREQHRDDRLNRRPLFMIREASKSVHGHALPFSLSLVSSIERPHRSGRRQPTERERLNNARRSSNIRGTVAKSVGPNADWQRASRDRNVIGGNRSTTRRNATASD